MTFISIFLFFCAQDLACLFEIYLKPLQNETFLTLDEVGGIYIMTAAAPPGVSWEVSRPHRTWNSLSVDYPEVTSMNSAGPCLPHYHCDWLEDKLAFPYTDLLASPLGRANKG